MRASAVVLDALGSQSLLSRGLPLALPSALGACRSRLDAVLTARALRRRSEALKRARRRERYRDWHLRPSGAAKEHLHSSPWAEHGE